MLGYEGDKDVMRKLTVANQDGDKLDDKTYTKNIILLHGLYEKLITKKRKNYKNILFMTLIYIILF